MTMSCDDAGTKPVRLAVFTGAGRRREWADETQARILAESFAGLESVSAVARRHGLCPSQLFTWRREARKAMEEAAPVFVPAAIESASVTAVPERSVRHDTIDLQLDHAIGARLWARCRTDRSGTAVTDADSMAAGTNTGAAS
ncbi:MAG: transposase, partial [Oxalobacteraceae bacterium]